MPIALWARSMGGPEKAPKPGGIKNAGIEIFSLWVWLSSSGPFPTTHTKQGFDFHHTLTPPRSIVHKPFNAEPTVSQILTRCRFQETIGVATRIRHVRPSNTQSCARQSATPQPCRHRVASSKRSQSPTRMQLWTKRRQILPRPRSYL